MMGAFGKFLEVSLPAGDAQRSLAFYLQLGFRELTTGDIRPWHYAVVTDGHIALGLHGAGIEEHSLTFVRPNLARQVRALQEAGHEFEFTRLGADEFHEAALRTPDGQLILMMEARSFSPVTTGESSLAVIGRCEEVQLACADVDASRDFFAAAGFLGIEEDDGRLRLTTPGLTLNLHSGAARNGAALRFASGHLRATLEALAGLDLPVKRQAGGYVLTAPEGTRLLLTD